MTKQKQYNTTHTNNNKITYKSAKKKKRMVNWSEYNKSLIRRGNISVYINEAVTNNAGQKPRSTGKVGHPKDYSDDLILFILTLRELLHLPLRQSIGFTAYLLTSLDLEWRLPDYSTLCRRMTTLPIDFCHNFRGKNIVFLLDSSGFKVYGEGEWKVRKHGVGYRRTWRETHIAIDYETRNIIGLTNTPSGTHDTTQLVPLLDQVLAKHTVNTVIGDGAYDSKSNYLLARELGVALIAPPPKNAAEHNNMYHYQLYDTPGWEDRNAVVRRVDEIGATAWKQEVDYHRRSLVENSFFRLKQLFGDKLKSRTEPAQYTEQCIKARLINRFNEIGLPQYTI